jgi:hypothetical protein
MAGQTYRSSKNCQAPRQAPAERRPRNRASNGAVGEMLRAIPVDLGLSLKNKQLCEGLGRSGDLADQLY